MNTVTAAGIVATTPRHVQTDEGLDITSFRLASNRRRYDDELQQWVDVDTNWYTVVAFRALAANAEKSLRKGDRVVVSGRVRIRDWEHDSGSGTSVEVEADALGHDLLWGTTTYTRSSVGDTDDEEE
jgi:single-strand DNA-binding protein